MRRWPSVPLRRIAALSVAIALFTTPIASAQSLDTTPAPANTALLSPAAFARLVQPAPKEVVPAPAVADWRRPSLLREGIAAMARQPQAAPTQAPKQKSWVSRHKAALGFIIAGGIVGALAVLANQPGWFDD